MLIILIVIGAVFWFLGGVDYLHEEYREKKARALGAKTRAKIRARKWFD